MEILYGRFMIGYATFALQVFIYGGLKIKVPYLQVIMNCVFTTFFADFHL